MKINPNSVSSYNNRGNAKSDLGNHEAAMADFGKALEINPDLISAYQNRGTVSFVLGRKNAAQSDLAALEEKKLKDLGDDESP